jgi:hypothetical protein
MSSKVTKAMPEIEALHSDLQTEGLQLLAEPLESDQEAGEGIAEEAKEERSGT